MGNTKELWKKLKYWQKGALLGTLIGVLFQIYIYSMYGDYTVTKINLLQFIPLFFYALLSNSTSDVLTMISFIFVVMWYTLLGTLFGVLYQYLKNKIKKHPKLLFFISLFIFILVIILINFFTMGLLFRNAG